MINFLIAKFHCAAITKINSHMIITSQVGYNMAGPTHIVMPWQPPTQSLKNVSGWDNDQYNPLPKFEPFCLYSFIVNLFFAWNIETTNHRDKQNLTKTRLMCWLIVLGFLNQNQFKKATKQLFYHPLKKDDVANVGLKR